MIKLLKLHDVTVNYQYYTEIIKIVNIYDKVIQNINSWQTSLQWCLDFLIRNAPFLCSGHDNLSERLNLRKKKLPLEYEQQGGTLQQT